MKKMLFAAALAFTFYLSPFTLKAQEATPSSVLTSIAQTQRQNATEVQKYQFKQTKHTPMLATDAVRMGYMVVGPQKYMEWHYTDADPYALVMEGEKCFMLKDGEKKSLKGRSGRMASRLAALMMELAAGGELIDGKHFDSSLAETSNTWVVTLNPRSRDMRKMMESAVLTFDKKTLGILTVKIVDQDAGFTLIEFEKK